MQALEIGHDAKHNAKGNDHKPNLELLAFRGNFRSGKAPVSGLMVVVAHANPSIGSGDDSFVRDRAQ